VADARSDLFDIPAMSDESGGVRVSEAVERRRGGEDTSGIVVDAAEPGTFDRSCEDAAADVPVVVSAAGPPGEDEVVLRADRARELVGAKAPNQVRCDFETSMRTTRPRLRSRRAPLCHEQQSALFGQPPPIQSPPLEPKAHRRQQPAPVNYRRWQIAAAQ
jgi:hypothetical protein